MTNSTTPATQALLPVTPEDEALFSELLRVGEFWPGHLWAERMKQAIARHRQSHSLPGDVGTADFVREDQCNDEFGTVPDCDCPHEHWHVGGICLDVHIEDDRTGHAILGNDDWQLEVSGVENLDEMRAIAFAWATQKFALTPSALSGDAGEGSDHG